MVPKRKVTLAPAFLAFFILSACGGGGGGGSSSAAAPPSSTINQPTNDAAESGLLPDENAGVVEVVDNASSKLRFVDSTADSGLSVTFGFNVPMANNEVKWIMPHGIAAGDYDGDGDVDLFIVRGDVGPNLLYRNMGDLVFEEVAELAGVAYTRSALRNWRHGSPAFADMDGDGHLDLFLCGLDGDPNKIFKNAGDGTFSDVTQGSGIDQMRAPYTSSPAFGDYDSDGDLDLALGHWGSPRDYTSAPNETEHLWRNDSTDEKIMFTPVTYGAGISPGILTIADSRITQRSFDNTFTPTFADINDDGHSDLLMAADFNFSQIFINNQDGTFTNVTDPLVIIDGNGMGSAVGDYDGDGDLDWFVSSILAQGEVPPHLSSIGNRLYRNEGGVLVDASSSTAIASGGWGWGSCFLDYENDMHLDIYQTNGWPEWEELGNFPTDTTRAFVNNGAASFTNQAEDYGLNDTEQGRGVVCADLDRDGDIDILQLHGNTANAVTLWENTSGGNYLTVELRGRAPNTQAIGAKVVIEAGQKWQLREMMLGNNFASHNPAEQHFGLGQATQINTLRIDWPDGTRTELKDLPANQHLVITQEAATAARLVVNQGSGSGFYQSGEAISVAAAQPNDEHYQFSHWTVSPLDMIADRFARDTMLMIPEGLTSVTVTANYLPGPAFSKPVSVARRWNEILLQAIRNDFARPTVHARNLFHVSAAMYDAWSAGSNEANPWLLGQTRASQSCEYNRALGATDADFKEQALSYAAYGLIKHRFANSPGGLQIEQDAHTLMSALGYDVGNTSTDLMGDSPAALGNYIAQCYVRFGLADGANEADDYANLHYKPVNLPLNPELPGNPDISDLNRWQPLSLSTFIDQSGNTIDRQPEFFGPEWGIVYPFALSERDVTIYQRDGFDYWVFHDPPAPPTLDGLLSDVYRWAYSLVAIWSSHLDPTDGEMLDISPASIGNISDYPARFQEYPQFYATISGGDVGAGYDMNPVTGQPYLPQRVPRGDYTRVLAEFWADGPDSETPPGHWFVILNGVNDHPLLERRLEGVGDVLNSLEWDVKSYFALGGAMHDAAIAAWGTKGWYDTIRPISALRAMADRGQSSHPEAPSYHVEGIPLEDGYIEVVTQDDVLAGEEGQHEGKMKLRAWRGPSLIQNPAADVAGVGWILAENWWSYQRSSFVTPPFAGYVSGHSTYSRAAAEVLTAITGNEYFPGGMSRFEITANEFLVFEEGPSVPMTLQWASYQDAADQCGLSRIWGGIHPPTDDIPGRLMGRQVGRDAFAHARMHFSGTLVE